MTSGSDMLNIFIESSDEFFAASTPSPDQVVLGQTSPIASQPEFSTNDRLRELIALTEQKELLAKVLGTRADKGVPFVTIGSEHGPELAGLPSLRYRLEPPGHPGELDNRMPYRRCSHCRLHFSRLPRMWRPEPGPPRAVHGSMKPPESNA